MMSLNLLLLGHSIFNSQLHVMKWLQYNFFSSRVLCVWDLSPQQSFQVVQDKRVLHIHLSSIGFESHAGVQLPLQLLPHRWRRPAQQVVLQCTARLRQVWLHRLLPAPFLWHVARRPAVHPVHAVSICLTLLHTHGASELVLGYNRSGVGKTELVAVSVTEVCRGEVTDEEASVCAVEDVLHQLQQTHGDLSFARPGGGEPLVHSPLHPAGDPGNKWPGERQTIEGPVGDSLCHVHVPTVAKEARSVSTVLKQQAQQHLDEQSRNLVTCVAASETINTIH